MEKENDSQNKDVRLTYRDRLKAAYADSNPQSDDDWNNLYEKYMNDTQEQIGKYKETEKVINDLMAADEDLAAVVSEMLLNKTPFRIALAKFLSSEDLIPSDGDDDYEAYQKAYNERLSAAEKRKAQMSEIEKNEKESFKNIDDFCAEKGYDNKEKDALIAHINDIFDNMVIKKITKEMIESFDKSLHFDSALETTAQEAEIKGKNAAIEAKRIQGVQKETGDGLPNITGGLGAAEKPETKKNPFFSSIKPRKSI